MKDTKISKPKIAIDISLISLAYHNILSKSEKLIFDKWINEDFEHLLYFERFKKYYEDGSVFDKEILDIDAELIKFKKIISRWKYSAYEDWIGLIDIFYKVWIINFMSVFIQKINIFQNFSIDEL